MNKLLVLISTVALIQVSGAISLGDNMNQAIATQTNTTTSVTKLIDTNDKYLTFKTAATYGETTFLVNKDTNRVYSISWKSDQAAKFSQIFGDKYYSEYINAKAQTKNLPAGQKSPIIKRQPLRGISFDDGDLTFSQYGSMLSGIQGTATVRSLAPQ